MSGLDRLLERLFATAAPPEVGNRARLLVLDTLGCAIAGLSRPKLRALAAVLPAGDAAALFATAACWDEACEGLPRAHGRPGVPVIAACLSQANASLGRLLDAVVTGYEVGGRMGERLRIRPGMHVDATWPALGVAAAVVQLHGGTPAQARAAMEIAACQMPFSLYLPIEQGADARNTYLGHAAWLGAFGARAALAGIEAPHGAAERFSSLALGREAPPVDDDGSYVLMEGYLKRYAAVRHVHYGAEAALCLRNRIADTAAITAIRLTIYAEAITYCANRAPRTPIQAQFSLSFGVAAALRFGRLDAELYYGEAFHDPELRRLEALVEVSEKRTDRRSATLVLETSEGSLEQKIDALEPLDADACRAKFLANAAPHLGEAAAEQLAEAVLDGSESRHLRDILPEPLP